jgi:hypothetical protein
METFIQLTKGILDLGVGLITTVSSLGIVYFWISSIRSDIESNAIEQYKKENNIK